MASIYQLPFEKEIVEAELALAKLETLGGDNEAVLRRMRGDLTQLKKTVYSNLTAWQTVLVARHPERPQFTDYINLIFDDWVELHGDRAFGDDRALRTGFAKLGDRKVLLVGHQKGKVIQERTACFYGCAHPEGYRKALVRMKQAAKFGLPVICLIDTPGAYPGIGAEERGQASLIATNLLEMARLPTPVVCVVIGEGGSGGALGIGVGDRVAILEYAYYSVISPEGCAGILWKTATEETKTKAADALKLTSRDLLRFGVVDEVIQEPVGGSHRNPTRMAATLKSFLERSLRELRGKPTAKLLDERYEKFRRMGKFLDQQVSPESNGRPKRRAAN